MKGINKFFYRIDTIKKWYFYISIPVMLLCWFYPVGMWLFILTPISAFGLIFGLVKLPMPTEEEIVKETYNRHKEYVEKLTRAHIATNTENDVLEGHSLNKTHLSRKIGSRAVYPECRTMALVETDDELDIYVKDSPLLENLRPAESQFKVCAPIDVTIDEMSNGNGILLTFMAQQPISIISLDKHRIKTVLSKHKKHLIYDASKFE